MRIGFLVSISIAILLCAIGGSAQPGDDGTLSVTVVDSSDQPVRGAKVNEAPAGTGGLVFIGRAFPTAEERGFKPLFRARDAERSSFIADMRCSRGLRFVITVSAEGYEPGTKGDAVRSCDQELKVVLTRNKSPLAQFEKLVELKGRLSDQLGRAITQRFLIIREGVEFVPKIAATGDYSVKLTPGLYEIRFEPFGCTEHVIKNYRIADQPRRLDFTVDCQ